MISLIEQLSKNELRIYQAVYERGPISRLRLAKGLNITRPAVTLYTQKLEDIGLINEVGKMPSSQKRGRPEIMLSINPSAGIIMSVYISLTDVTCALVKLNGNIIEKTKSDLDFDQPPEEVLEIIYNSLKEKISKYNFKEEQVFGIGIALPGVINYQDGIVKEQSRKGWNGYNIREYFEKRFGQKILIENDVKAFTLGEFYFGIGRHVDDLVCFWVKDGIGAGIMIHGKILRGYSGSAGEIGFNEFILEKKKNSSLLVDSKVESWGNILSHYNISNAIKRGVNDGWKTSLTIDSSIDDFFQAFMQEDPLARFLYGLISDVLGAICCNIAYTYNPRLLVLAGPLFENLPSLASDAKHHMEIGTLGSPIIDLDLKTSVLGEDSILLGNVAYHLEEIFKASEHSVIKEYQYN